MKRIVRVGTRGSRLALAQTRQVIRILRSRSRRAAFKIVVIETRGDKDQSGALLEGPAVGVFTKELEKALLDGRIDLAVHSLKDLPTALAKGLVIAAYCKREDPRDCLVTRGGRSLDTLASGSIVGTSSPRRRLQVHALRPDLKVVALRGNLTTRLRKVSTGALDGALVAAAGLKRAGLFRAGMRPVPYGSMLPCPAQGILAVETRARDGELASLAAAANDRRAEREGRAERELLRILEGGCRVPIGALARSRGAALRLDAVVCSTKNRGLIRASGAASRGADPLILARRVARRLVRLGAGEFRHETRPS